MIRLATKDDLPEMARLGRLFFNESGYKSVCDYDPDSVIENLTLYLDNDLCILILAEKDGEIIGMTGAVLVPFYFNKSILMSHELFWWAHPDHRGLTGKVMLDALEKESKESGAKCMVMVSLENVNPQRVGRLYELRGYKVSEHQYLKVI